MDVVSRPILGLRPHYYCHAPILEIVQSYPQFRTFVHLLIHILTIADTE